MIDPSKGGVTGPLALQAQGFWGELTGVGYTPRTARDHLYVLAHLSRWLADEGLGAAELTPPVVEAFLRARRGAGYGRWLTARSLRPLLEYLRRVGAIPPAEPRIAEAPVERLVEAYRGYLVGERRLAATTVRSHGEVARRFLSTLAAGGELDFDRLGPAQVTGFVVGESPRYSTGSMKVLTTALRSLLRFLVVIDVVDKDLSAAVPAIASWRMTAFPRGVDACVVTALLGSCDRTTPVGVRDFAVLTLLVRLGLRAAEVAALRLEDVDWRAGELVVRGKGNRVDRLPLPHDVGAALVDYLRGGRPRSAGRVLFLRGCAPEGGMSARSVAMVPRSASLRAGVPIVGAHRLRHTAATGMLRRGASLPEVAQVLRHHSESTTATYAKVDRAALDLVVRPWPGARR
jgi:integrase/recombinase XerD